MQVSMRIKRKICAYGTYIGFRKYAEKGLSVGYH